MMKYSSIDIITLILFATIGLIIPTAIVLRHFFSIDPLALLHITWGRTFMGALFTLLAIPTCLLNGYLTFYVPWRYQREHGSMEGFASMSGLPVIGGIFLCLAGALMPPSAPFGIFLLLLYAIDGNGIPWFFVFVIREGV